MALWRVLVYTSGSALKYNGKARLIFQPCFSLFSIVIHELVSIPLILPQRFLCFLNVPSLIASVENNNFSQPSVSAHSFLAISNLECISAMLTAKFSLYSKSRFSSCFLLKSMHSIVWNHAKRVWNLQLVAVWN